MNTDDVPPMDDVPLMDDVLLMDRAPLMDDTPLMDIADADMTGLGEIAEPILTDDTSDTEDINRPDHDTNILAPSWAPEEGIDVADAFNEFLFDGAPEQPVHGGNENPYLEVDDDDDDDDDDESNLPPSVLTPTLLKDLESAMENAELPSELEGESDPTETETIPRAGEVKRNEEPNFQKIVEGQIQEGGSPFYPFRNATEFQLSKWLNGLPLSKVDPFLQLDWVSLVSSGLDHSDGIVPASSE
jgi:hypothetical protein